MKNVISKVISIVLILATLMVALIITTIYINESSLTDSTVINVAGRQRMLSQKIIQEVLYYTQQPDRDLNRVYELIGEFEMGLENLIYGSEEKGIFSAPSITILESLEGVKKQWQPLKDRFDGIDKLKSEVSAQSEAFLLLTPKFFQATFEVAHMMERRRLPQRMVVDAENQIGLANSMVILASSYLATTNEKALDEFYSTVESYAGTLDGFANTDMIVHGSILALLADNQLLWEGFHDAVIKAVSGKKLLAQEVHEIYSMSNELLVMLEKTIEEYTKYSQKIRNIMQWVQYLFALLLVVALVYSLILVAQMKEYFGGFNRHIRDINNIVDLDSQDIDERSADDMESFVKKIGALLATTKKIHCEIEHIKSEASDPAGDKGAGNVAAADSGEYINKVAELLKNLQIELDKLAVKSKDK